MPIFISHSHQDSDFVDALAKRLIVSNHHVWLDRWELNLGDSLSQRIQDAMTDASAILVILSNHSVRSQWCQRELNAGLVRELEEKRTMVMACVVDDCEIPLFLRDKLYADFYRRPDHAWNLLNTSLAHLANPYQGTDEQGDYHTDWAMTWTIVDGVPEIKWTFVMHGQDLPYVVLCECTVMPLPESVDRVLAALQREQNAVYLAIARAIVDEFDGKPPARPLDDHQMKFIAMHVALGDLGEVGVVYTYRRLGNDNGMDTFVNLSGNIEIALQHFQEVTRRP